MREQNTRKDELLMERYGADSMPENIIWNDQIENILSHRSIRRYLPKALPEGTIETMIAAAQSASNSGNLNLWSVIAITDPKLKAKLGEASRKGSKLGMGNPYIEQAPLLLMWVADLYRNSQIASLEGEEQEVHKYLDSMLMASVDTALASQNAALAAESIGLGVVYLGVMRNNAKEVSELLNLPKSSYVVFGMAVGIPDPNEPGRLRPRPNQDVVLHQNVYDKDKWNGQIDAYEKEFLKFREDLGLKDKKWIDAVRTASNDMIFMEGRENLSKTLKTNGFELR